MQKGRKYNLGTSQSTRVIASSLQADRQAPAFPGTALLSRKPEQSRLTTLSPGKASPSREAIPMQVTA